MLFALGQHVAQGFHVEITLLWSQRAHTETKLRDSKVRFNVAYSQDRTHVHVGSALWPAFDFLE